MSEARRRRPAPRFRPRNLVVGKLFDSLSPVTRRLLGPEFDRRNEVNLGVAGLDVVEIRQDGF